MRKIFMFILSGGILLSLKSCVFGQTKMAANTTDSSKTAIYPIMLKTLDGTGNIDFSAYKGKKILVVNTASECGYTPQYEGLEKLYKQYGDKLVVIGCPCNQFGGQEPGDTSEIRNFCTTKFSVTFPMSEKLDVKGKSQHPLFTWLTSKTKNGVLDAEVLWNFNKFLIDENGFLMAYFPSKVKPDDAELLKLINQ
ncbi:MAG: glutathione peroxidase [Bacteroidia bacterium]|nr:glutathione peroxidase [Bacteroidia bacterium]